MKRQGLVTCVLGLATAGLIVGACGSAASRAKAPAHLPGAHHARLAGYSFVHESAARAASRLGLTLPADCVPAPSGPPGSPYQLGLVGKVTNGTLTAGPATVAHITATFCGVVTLVNGTPPCAATGSVNAPTDGQVFGSLTASLDLVPGMTPKVPFTAHPGLITGGFACQPSNNGLQVNMSAVVSGSTGLYGLSCTIGPLTIPLSGVLTGPLDDTSITLKSNDFAVPTVTPSASCPGEVPSNLDLIAGLPIAAGGATVTLPATATLYQPAG